jgi:hypothetical protein
MAAEGKEAGADAPAGGDAADEAWVAELLGRIVLQPENGALRVQRGLTGARASLLRTAGFELQSRDTLTLPPTPAAQVSAARVHGDLMLRIREREVSKAEAELSIFRAVYPDEDTRDPLEELYSEVDEVREPAVALLRRIATNLWSGADDEKHRRLKIAPVVRTLGPANGAMRVLERLGFAREGVTHFVVPRARHDTDTARRVVAELELRDESVRAAREGARRRALDVLEARSRGGGGGGDDTGKGGGNGNGVAARLSALDAKLREARRELVRLRQRGTALRIEWPETNIEGRRAMQFESPQLATDALGRKWRGVIEFRRNNGGERGRQVGLYLFSPEPALRGDEIVRADATVGLFDRHYRSCFATARVECVFGRRAERLGAELGTLDDLRAAGAVGEHDALFARIDFVVLPRQ